MFRDVGIILDVSGSMFSGSGGNETYNEKAVEFINELIKIASFTQYGSHGALVRFGDENLPNDDMLEIKFSDQLDSNGFAEALNSSLAKGNGGGTDIINALDVSLDRMFQTSSGMREDAVKVAVLITDGKDYIDDNENEYTERGQLFKSRKIKLLVVGVADTDSKDLKQLVQSSEDFFQADKFEDLIGNVTEVIGALICKGILL